MNRHVFRDSGKNRDRVVRIDMCDLEKVVRIDMCGLKKVMIIEF